MNVRRTTELLKKYERELSKRYSSSPLEHAKYGHPDYVHWVCTDVRLRQLGRDDEQTRDGIAYVQSWLMEREIYTPGQINHHTVMMRESADA